MQAGGSTASAVIHWHQLAQLLALAVSAAANLTLKKYPVLNRRRTLKRSGRHR